MSRGRARARAPARRAAAARPTARAAGDARRPSPTSSRSSSTRRGRRGGERRTRRCPRVEVRKQREVLEHHADASLLRCDERRRRGDSRPEISILPPSDARSRRSAAGGRLAEPLGPAGHRSPGLEVRSAPSTARTGSEALAQPWQQIEQRSSAVHERRERSSRAALRAARAAAATAAAQCRQRGRGRKRLRDPPPDLGRERLVADRREQQRGRQPSWRQEDRRAPASTPRRICGTVTGARRCERPGGRAGRGLLDVRGDLQHRGTDGPGACGRKRTTM